MQIRWSPEASLDFAGIVEYIRQQNPPAAGRVARNIYENIAGLEAFPQRGRVGRVPGTRELVLVPLPFIVVYRIREDWIEIARVLHGSNSGLRRQLRANPLTISLNTFPRCS